MAEDPRYKANIAHDREYIKSVAKSISQKGPLEEIPFHLLTDVLNALHIDSDPYEIKSAEAFDAKKIEALSHEAFQRVQQRLDDELLKREIQKLWDYLGESDKLKKADLIFVFGSFNDNAARLAAKLYKDSWAPLILFTGRTATYLEKTGESEAKHFASIAEGEGVPCNAILLEEESINTPENAINGLRVLREHRIETQRIILITYSYHMRRAYLTFKSVFGSDRELIRQPVGSSKATRDDFFTNEGVWNYIFFEFIKIHNARLMKHF